MASRMAGRPDYLRIADALREKIRDGAYKDDGGKLPSERLLRDEFKAAGGTIRAALAQLRDEGRVVAYQGRGVYVREQTTRRKVGTDRSWGDIVRRSGKQNASGAPAISREACPAKVAELLGIDPDEVVTVRDRLLRVEGEPPDLISVSWHPAWIIEQIPDLADPTKKTSMVAAHEDLGLKLHARDVFSSRKPTDAERDRLELAPGDVVTEQWGVTYDQDDRPLYAIHHVAGGHRIEFAVAYDFPTTS